MPWLQRRSHKIPNNQQIFIIFCKPYQLPDSRTISSAYKHVTNLDTKTTFSQLIDYVINVNGKQKRR